MPRNNYYDHAVITCKNNGNHLWAECVKLHHNVITGRSVTGVLHMLNKTIVDWHRKK